MGVVRETSRIPGNVSRFFNNFHSKSLFDIYGEV